MCREALILKTKRLIVNLHKNTVQGMFVRERKKERARERFTIYMSCYVAS